MSPRWLRICESASKRPTAGDAKASRAPFAQPSRVFPCSPCSPREFQRAAVNGGRWRLTGVGLVTWVNVQVGPQIQQCPRQDSNLRTRLRRPMLYPLSYEGGASQTSAPRRRSRTRFRPSQASSVASAGPSPPTKPLVIMIRDRARSVPAFRPRQGRCGAAPDSVDARAARAAGAWRLVLERGARLRQGRRAQSPGAGRAARRRHLNATCRRTSPRSRSPGPGS